MHIIKGMVQVLGTTYRIARVRHETYQVTRIRDDAIVGSFACERTVQVTALLVEASLMRRIACAAVHQGKTSWMGDLGPLSSKEELRTSSQAAAR